MIEIIPARAEHAELIAHLNQRVQTLHINNTSNFFKQSNIDELIQWFKDALLKSNTLAFIATDGNKSIGYILASIIERPEDVFTKQKRWVYIDHISVECEWERKGIGSKLFHKLLEIADNEGITDFLTDTWSFNETAQEFFKNIGFQPLIIKYYMKKNNQNHTTNRCSRHRIGGNRDAD